MGKSHGFLINNIFTFVHINNTKNIIMKLTIEQKQANKLARQEAKEQAKKEAKIQAEKNQRPVDSITLTIEWKKSKMWGSNPHLSAEVKFKPRGNESNYDHFTATCSGCGYDKASTVIANVFNAYLKYKLYKPLKPIPGYLNGKDTTVPYGIYHNGWKYYSGGIGTDCYYKISEAIFGKFERIASGSTFDVYKYTDLE